MCASFSQLRVRVQTARLIAEPPHRRRQSTLSFCRARAFPTRRNSKRTLPPPPPTTTTVRNGAAKRWLQSRTFCRWKSTGENRIPALRRSRVRCACFRAFGSVSLRCVCSLLPRCGLWILLYCAQTSVAYIVRACVCACKRAKYCSSATPQMDIIALVWTVVKCVCAKYVAWTSEWGYDDIDEKLLIGKRHLLRPCIRQSIQPSSGQSN